MRKLLICVGLIAASTLDSAVAHPTQLLFASRGECEREQAKVNNYDRQYVAEPIFGIENNGQAQVFFLESFQCEYDASMNAWRMFNRMGDDSGVGNAWDGPAGGR